MNFPMQHASTLLKYGGISFIAGAVNHGFFSEVRSLVTAAIGVGFYLLGAGMEMYRDGQRVGSWRNVFGWGIMLSIGIGFFTGGLQHFPDSPARSAWVVPLGFALSLASMFWLEGRAHAPRAILVRYATASLAVVLAGSYIGYQALQSDAEGGMKHAHNHDHGVALSSDPTHSHGTADASAHNHDHAQSPSSAAAKQRREVAILMNDDMQFIPSQVEVKQGDLVSFKVINIGKVKHEFVLGSADALRQHADAMKQAAGSTHQHNDGDALSLAPGEFKTIDFNFDRPEDVGIGCFEPGHYEAGMRGTIRVAVRN